MRINPISEGRRDLVSSQRGQPDCMYTRNSNSTYGTLERVNVDGNFAAKKASACMRWYRCLTFVVEGVEENASAVMAETGAEWHTTDSRQDGKEATVGRT